MISTPPSFEFANVAPSRAAEALDDQGNFCGTTSTSNTGFGEVFELTSYGSLEVLYVFSDHGGLPNGVIRDSSGNLYGTTEDGALAGTVFKLDTNGNETVLYSFKEKSDGAFPYVPPVMDKAGNLFGTASQYGYEKGKCDPPDSTEGCGTVFKVNTAGVFSVLFAFHYVDGQYPGPLMENADAPSMEQPRLAAKAVAKVAAVWRSR